VIKSTSELMEQLTKVGNALDTETDPAVMRFLITSRKAIVAELEARHTKPTNLKESLR
jgi:hypothetical protein